MAGDPYLKFYPGDWRKDPGVQSLDYFERGVWFELLLFMHESEERGVLIARGHALSDLSISRLLGLQESETQDILDKLVKNNIAARCDDTGALLCRRMCRESHLSAVRADAGKRGAAVTNFAAAKRPAKHRQNCDSDSDSERVTKGGVQGGKDPPPSKQAELIFEAYPRRVGKRAALMAIERALKRGVSFETLLERTKAYAVMKAPLKDTEEWKYVPYPATWFNQDRHEDEDENVSSNPKQPLGRAQSKPGKYDNVIVHRAEATTET